MKADLLRAVVKAYAGGNFAHLKTLLRQAVASSRSERLRHELRPLLDVPTMTPLPKEVQSLVTDVPQVSFEDLVLVQRLQSKLRAVVEEHAAASHLMAIGLRPRSRFLFTGAPGNGKSSAAYALGDALGMSTYAVNVPQLVDSYLGATSKNIARLFGGIGSICLVLDEIDAVGTARNGRSDAADRERNTILTTLLTELDRNQGGVLIATTNRPDLLDPALVRRFDAQFEFPAPTDHERALLVERFAERFHPVTTPTPEGFVSAGCFDQATKMLLTAYRDQAVRQWRSEKESAA